MQSILGLVNISDANGVLTSSGYTETSAKPRATRHPLAKWIPIVRTAEDDKYSQPGGMRLKLVIGMEQLTLRKLSHSDLQMGLI